MRIAGDLAWGRLRQRYKRFLADVELPDGRVVAAHVANSGSMRGCSAPGSPCLVAASANPARRLAWTLEQVVAGGVPVGVNTARANALAEEALRSGVVGLAGLGAAWSLRREVRISARSRCDLCLDDGRGPTWVEVKNVSWAESGVALFPDAVTARGAKHLGELAARVGAGERAAVLYVVQRGDATAVRAAAEVDPTYAAAFAAARAAGVAAVAVQVAVAPAALVPWRTIPVLD